MSEQKVTSRNPWAFIPTLYLAEGIPYVLINQVSVVVFKNMQLDNDTISFYTSWLYLPWVIKMFWGPMIDTNSTKRNWIIYTQLLLGISFTFVAVALHLPAYFVLSLIAFFLGAFVSASHDIAADGFYLLSLNKSDQAGFVGIRGTFYRFAMIFGSGFLVWLAGFLQDKMQYTVVQSWSISFGIASGLYLLIFVYHRFILPYPEIDIPATKAGNPFTSVFKSYFTQDKILLVLSFIFFYRFGEAFLLKLNTPFFLDKREIGGLGLTTEQVGLVYGTIGIGFLLLGGISGGLIIKKYGLKKCIWPMAVIINLPMIIYVTMSFLQPVGYQAIPFVAFEQFSYGFGFTAYMVYLMYLANKSQYKTAHFAISTGLMALGMMLPGLVAGKLQLMMGYRNFFILTALLGIPGIITLFFVPLEDEEPKQA
jgi:PAT family beta-lactamase induction signal transducer AmpG